jgi:hypothetical protein
MPARHRGTAPQDLSVESFGATREGLAATNSISSSSETTADAHALLASALEGFSATPEFPEIQEAQTLLGICGYACCAGRAVTLQSRRPEVKYSLVNKAAW